MLCPCLIKPKTKSVKFNLNPSALSLAKLITRLQRVLRRVKPHNNTISWGGDTKSTAIWYNIKKQFSSQRARTLHWALLLTSDPHTHTFRLQAIITALLLLAVPKTHFFSRHLLAAEDPLRVAPQTHDWWSSENCDGRRRLLHLIFILRIHSVARIWARHREWVCFIGI